LMFEVTQTSQRCTLHRSAAAPAPSQQMAMAPGAGTEQGACTC